MERMCYYIAKEFRLGTAEKGGAIVDNGVKQDQEGKEELLQRNGEIREEIVRLLEKVSGRAELERIRRFVAYIYIHH